MHELGLLRAVVRAVDAAARAAGADAVERVGLRVGALSGAVPEALQGAWPIATAGTKLAGAELRIDAVEAAVWCPNCACEQGIDQFYALRCPACGTPCGQLVRGREFEVAYAEVPTPPAGPPT